MEVIIDVVFEFDVLFVVVLCCMFLELFFYWCIVLGGLVAFYVDFIEYLRGKYLFICLMFLLFKGRN